MNTYESCAYSAHRLAEGGYMVTHEIFSEYDGLFLSSEYTVGVVLNLPAALNLINRRIYSENIKNGQRNPQ